MSILGTLPHVRYSRSVWCCQVPSLSSLTFLSLRYNVLSGQHAIALRSCYGKPGADGTYPGVQRRGVRSFSRGCTLPNRSSSISLLHLAFAMRCPVLTWSKRLTDTWISGTAASMRHWD